MTKQILVTGGAGFIGSHLADALLERGYRVTVLDSLEKQVHGTSKPDYLDPRAKYIWGSVLDPAALQSALSGAEAAFYFSASVGVGQSMYEIERYVHNNSLAAARFLQKVVDLPPAQRPRKLVVASSMSLYGEGRYLCPRCGPMDPPARSRDQMQGRQWEPICPGCRSRLDPVSTPESKLPQPTSIYAITKRDHEELFLAVGRAYGIPSVALRFFNVYGTRQALSNPYTGVLAIFCARVLNDRPPYIFEDGLQTRDFICVSDIVQACLLALERPQADYEILNVGTGRPVSILEVAQKLQEGLEKNVKVEISGKFREGDIRHCTADISKIGRLLGFKPRVFLEQGIPELLSWVRTQNPEDCVPEASEALERRGLSQ